jgi:tRNA-specific 2-thiouridylase
VDSSCAAALLLEQGYEVVGVTLRFWSKQGPAGAEAQRRGEQALADARAVCDRLGIQFQVVDAAAAFQREVIHYFAREYNAGRTPNPCVVCNQKLKFATLLGLAPQLAAEHIATGHYARLQKDPATGRTLLKRGRDPRTDQSYFLFALGQDQLDRALFPMGEMTKDYARQTARRHQLVTADKAKSLEICFVPDNDYRRFLQFANLAQNRRGEIVDQAGKVLGYHAGIQFYTIGQRRGLRVSAPEPLYVIGLDVAQNRVVVGGVSALARDELRVARCNWIPFEAPPSPLNVLAKIRYHHLGSNATVIPTADGGATVRFHAAQRAITPGQACVFYQGDLVLGGGWIQD